MLRLSKTYKHQHYFLLKMPKVREDEYSFGSIGVVPPIEPMHLISALSLWAGHTLSKIWKSLSTPQFLQVKVLDLHTCTLSKMLPASTTSTSLQTAERTRNMGDTISRGASYQGLYYGTRWCTYRMNMVRGPI
jgi:hypothetical protein